MRHFQVRFFQIAGLFMLIALLEGCTGPSTRGSESAGPLEARVDSLLALMTLEEKIGQTNMYNGSWEFTGPVPDDADSQLKVENIKKGRVGGMLNVLTAAGIREAQKMAVENSRLGIPMIFGYDVIHGYKTMLPVPIAQAASWDMEVARKGSQIAAKESSAAGLHWTFAPMIDISRDARWGRIMEGPGEDPYLGSVMAKGWVEGLQGDDLSSPRTIAACAKHFAGYGFGEAGKDYNTAEISMQTLYNVVLPPFKAAQEAGALTFMNSFNDVNGIPATGDDFLQRTILKDKWGFDGFMVSDWGSIIEMLDHGHAKDTAHAAEIAMNAGSDMDMEGRTYERGLQGRIESGAVDLKLLDDAVRRILRTKFRLGLFDDPYAYSDEMREKQEVFSEENLQAAREVARETFVLLKNEESILPLKKDIGSIAVIGQLAASKDVALGNWRAQAEANSASSLLEGVENAVSEQTQVRFAEGYKLTEGIREFGRELTFIEGDKSGFKQAVQLARQSEVVILAMGEDCYQTGEGRSQIDVRLKSNQNELLEEIKKVNNNVVVVLMTGRPVAIPEVAEKSSAILQTWFAGSEAGNAIADVLFGDYSPSGKLPVSFPYVTGQEPLYYNSKSTGRPNSKAPYVFWAHYTDGPNEALFPFGFGLSYTTFEYSDLSVVEDEEKVTVQVTVTNTGEKIGTEVVQLYIRDLVASPVRPVLELKGFEKTSIEAGGSKKVTFELTREDLASYDQFGELIFEAGEFEISVGTNSADLLAKRIELK